eukprot:TRINITY_DN6444_c0_g1_i1.p2 TRINITY_DN6444_c0_g1~~TRINITY_DN6444_c0_g1_i1.p2  ORF type:complete len:191 (+),score=14.79 TRINITY_DN6444_c0_g1_i1:352-924(+)
MAFSGMLCGMVAYWITCPFWFIKTRLQATAATGPGGAARPQVGLLSTMRTTLASAGIRGLWRGATPLVARGGVMRCGQFVGYDWTKSALRGSGYTDGPAVHVASSVMSALLCTLWGAPADLTMTRWVAGLGSGRSSNTLLACVAAIWRDGGATAFWRGWGPSFARVLPIMLGNFSLYEQIRRHLGMGYLD